MRTKSKMCDVVRLCVRWQLAIVQRSIGWEREREKDSWNWFGGAEKKRQHRHATSTPAIRTEYEMSGSLGMIVIYLLFVLFASDRKVSSHHEWMSEYHLSFIEILGLFARLLVDHSQSAHKITNGTIRWNFFWNCSSYRRDDHRTSVWDTETERGRKRERELYGENCILENGLKWSDHEHHNQ